VIRATLAPQVLRVHKACKDLRVILVPQDPKVRRVPLVLLDRKEPKATPVLPVHKARRVTLVQLVHRGRRVTRVPPVHKVRRVILALLDLKVLREHKDPLVLRDRLDRKVRRVYLEQFPLEATFS
jgi:hypothetical protein